MFLSQYSGDIKETQVPVDISLSDDVDKWENYVVQLFFENDDRSLEEIAKPVGSLNHIWQVKLISSEIVDTAVNCQDHECEKKNAEIFALAHDLGRVHDHPLHPHIGAQMFSQARRSKQRELATANGNRHIVEDEMATIISRRRFTSAHHFWGMGDPSMKFYSRVEDAAVKDNSGHFKQWDEQRLMPLFDEIRDEFGLPGIAATIADLSKAYPDISTYEKAQQPVVGALNRESAELLIERLVILRSMRRREIQGDFSFLENVTYEELIAEDNDYDADRLGAEFALRLIQFATDEYGIDYEAAVAKAGTKWHQEKDNLDKLWSQKLADKYAVA